MTGPVRIAKQPPGSLEVELLRHARAESPPPGDLARLAVALGLGAATCSTASACQALGSAMPQATAAAKGLLIEPPVTAGALNIAASAMTNNVGKNVGQVSRLSATAQRWLLLGGTCVVVALGAISSLKGQRQSGASVPAAVSVALGPVATVSNSVKDTSGSETIAVRNANAQLANTPGLASLAPEIALLDQARTSVSAGKPDVALKLLDSYDAEFPTGTLLPEAKAIRVQALLQSGQRGSAVKVGLDFLSSAPASPHAHRIRQLLGSEADGQPKRSK